MHSTTNKNKFYHNFEQAPEARKKLFRNTGNDKDMCRTLINDNFQTINVNHFFNSSS
ncbi:MAG: hypothetical protein LN588_04525 [Rickettsia endosymbiont of Bryobia graminum]|nr:hypothetical protein [Rickettsia endosymbiont of Bryobia graminum]